MVRITLPVPANIKTRAQVLEEKWNLRSLTLVTLTVEDPVEFLAERRLLKNSSICCACNISRTVIKNNCSDKIIWRCPTGRGKKSIRESSFFSDSNLELLTVITFMYCWAKDMPLKNCSKEVDGPSPNTECDWANFCRDICAEWLLTHPRVIGGFCDDGNGNIVPAIVEIDESYVFHRKYHRGRYTPGAWIFGGIQGGDWRFFFGRGPKPDKKNSGSFD
ncbi:hypothetical protein TCAL_09000 [Tigriopus californicus]|uniref:Uncharacterized protein n=1 Tax=Tigriopus californicus TaxID=6832 RepID=A0A553PU73_TIGCA|nr:hypothetical protein TCAL_09000 [Tigriopus californicus]|eukprot:TCALIF_09000-PA protein Name:"Protein of unknown function" AED:0.21 eAED:0.29 QI:0/-1/0/1/-1/1/1/0/218